MQNAENYAKNNLNCKDIAKLLSKITEWPVEKRNHMRAHAFTLGLMSDGRAVLMSNTSKRYPCIHLRIFEFCTNLCKQYGFVFNSVEIDFNFVDTVPIVRNQGWQVYVALGNFSGGEMKINHEFVNTDSHNAICLNSDNTHACCNFRGKKIGIRMLWLPTSASSLHFPIVSSSSYSVKIEIVSRDLGMWNTLVHNKNGVIQLPYKKQGVWALKLENEVITDFCLIDTYFSQTFELKPWDPCIYTVSDTACAVSRPLPYKFYTSFHEKYNLKVPKIEYRMPFALFASRKFSCALIGNRQHPFTANFLMNKAVWTASCSNQTYSTPQAIEFD
jgi:hypothetical protein